MVAVVRSLGEPPPDHANKMKRPPDRPPDAGKQQERTKGALSSFYQPPPSSRKDLAQKAVVGQDRSTRENFAGVDPLQSPPNFRNPKNVPKRTRPISFAAATWETHKAPLFPSVAVRKPVVVEDEEMIQFTPAEVNQMAAAFTWSLIGKFTLGRPSMMDILTSMKNALTFQEEIFPVALDQRHVLIRFRNREDFVKAYIKETWFIKGKRMRVFRWSPNFSLGSESSCAPVWVGLPTLRAHLHDPGAIQSIAGLLGKFLCMHKDVTNFTRPGYAYVCVEMDLAKPIKKVITIDNGGEVIKQKVDYRRFLPLLPLLRYDRAFAY